MFSAPPSFHLCLLILFFGCLNLLTALAAEPPAVLGYRPAIGIPEEARRQERLDEKHGRQTLASHLSPVLESVSVRYHSQIWTNQSHASNYLAGLLVDAKTYTATHQFWSQGVGSPELECLLTFTNGQTGKLLIDGPYICFRDQTNRWWFASAQEHYEQAHPRSWKRSTTPIPQTTAANSVPSPERTRPVRTIPTRPLLSPPISGTIPPAPEAKPLPTPPPPVYRIPPITFENEVDRRPPDFSRYLDSAAFRAYLHAQTNAVAHRQQGTQLLITTFPTKNAGVYQLTFTGGNLMRLQHLEYSPSAQGLLVTPMLESPVPDISKSYAEIPSDNATPPLSRLVLISLYHGTNWVTFSYDRGSLPRYIEGFYDVSHLRLEDYTE
ncbi:MAG: hypothetical protein K0Q55_2006 [Verrucomicrobia bacterium]|jgi:hypothetical protein|nr:hypothetical protein [Verrucomicrobiota bacterium]